MTNQMTAMLDYAKTRTHMIDSQLRPNKVTDPHVIAAFENVPREVFVPEGLKGVAYIDEDLPLGGGHYLVEPMVLARLVQAANIQRTDKVLDVGSGSGYSAAVLRWLADSVVALEADEGLATRSRAQLSAAGIGNVDVVQNPLARGHAARGPYDVIVIAGGVAEVPLALMDQLAEGGRLVAVLRDGSGRDGLGKVGQAVLIGRKGGMLSRRPLFDAGVPCVPGFDPVPEFQF